MLPRFSILVPSFQMQLTVPSPDGSKVPSSILAATNFFIFFFPIFSFSSTLFLCIIFDFLMKKPHILAFFFFLKKRKTTIRGGHLTFEGGPGCGRFEKKNPAKPFKQRKTLPSEKKSIAKTNSSTLFPPP